MGRIVFATGSLTGRDGRRRARLAELGELLHDRLQVDVVAAEVERYEELLSRLGTDFDLCWMAPALVVRALAKRGATVLVSAVRAPGALYHGTLFVRESSNLRTPEDLRGARVAWVDPDSCSGYLFPRMALVLRGLDPDQLFKEQVSLGSHAAVARAVAERRADVGATFMNVDATARNSGAFATGWEKLTDEPMRPILVTEPIPADAIVAASRVAPETREALLGAFGSLHETPRGAAVLGELFDATRLEPTNERSYASVRAALGAEL